MLQQSHLRPVADFFFGLHGCRLGRGSVHHWATPQVCRGIGSDQWFKFSAWFPVWHGPGLAMSQISVPAWQGTASHLGPLAFLSFLHCSYCTCTLSFKLLSVKMCGFFFLALTHIRLQSLLLPRELWDPGRKNRFHCLHGTRSEKAVVFVAAFLHAERGVVATWKDSALDLLHLEAQPELEICSA